MSTTIFYLLNECYVKKVYLAIKKDSLDNFEPAPSFVPLLLPLGSLHQIGSFSDKSLRMNPRTLAEELGNLRLPHPAVTHHRFFTYPTG